MTAIRDMTALAPGAASAALRNRAAYALPYLSARRRYSTGFSVGGAGGTVSGVGGASALSLRSRFSSFFCFLARSLWRLAKA